MLHNFFFFEMSLFFSLIPEPSQQSGVAQAFSVSWRKYFLGVHTIAEFSKQGLKKAEHFRRYNENLG